MNRLSRILLAAAAVVLSAQLTGCASLTMGQPKSTIENTMTLRGSDAGPVAVGAFTAAAGVNDKQISLRGANTVASPSDGSFAKYVGETLKAELQAAGLFDAASGTVVTGTLTRSEVDAAIGTGKGELASRFVVTRAGAVKYDREVKVNSTWDSSFIGGVAIPAAATQYEALYRKLVGALLADADFRKAVAK